MKQKLYNFQSKQFEDIDSAEVPKLVIAGSHGFPKGEVSVISADGQVGSIPSENAQRAFQSGFQLDSPELSKQRELKEKFGDSPLLAGVAGAARSASFGLTDVIGKAAGVDEELNALKEFNPNATVAGEVVGGIASAVLLPGGGLVGGAAKIGQAVSRSAGSEVVKGLVAKAAAKGLGSAVEGSLYGVGQTVSEAALGDPEKAAERLIGNVGLSALLGGGLSFVMEAGAPVVKAGLSKGKQLLPGMTQTIDEAGNAIAGTGTAQSINKVTSKLAGLFGADDAEYLSLLNNPQGRAQARQVAKEFADGGAEEVIQSLTLLDDTMKERIKVTYTATQTDMLLQNAGNDTALIAASGRIATKIENAFRSIVDSPDFFQAETAKIVSKSRQVLNNETPTFKELTQALEQALSAKSVDKELVGKLKGQIELEKAKSLLNVRRYLDDGIDFNKQVTGTSDDLKLLRGLREETDKEIAKLPGGDKLKDADKLFMEFLDSHGNFFREVMKRGADGRKEIDLQKTVLAMKSGGARGSKLDSLIEKMEVFGSKLGGSEIIDELNLVKTVRDKLKTYKSIEALKTNLGPSGRGALLGGAIAGDVIPGVGLAALPVIAPNTYLQGADSLLALAALERNGVNYGNKISTAVTSFLDNVNKKGASGSVKGAVSGSILDRANFGDTEKTESASVYNKRLETLSKYVNDPQSLAEKMTAQMKVGADVPGLTTAAVSKAQAAVQFLYEKAPKDNRNPSMFGSKPYKPSPSEQAKFERYVRAVENPMTVMDDLKNGALSRESVEALRVVYPQMYEEIRGQLMDKLTEKTEIPYATKMQINALFGVEAQPRQLTEIIQGSFGVEQTKPKVRMVKLTNNMSTGLDNSLNRR